MAYQKLTPSINRRITRDWKERFPEFGVKKPRSLLRRAGPLLEGINLDRDSSNDGYYPTFHVHCLCQPFPDIALRLRQRLRSPRSGAEEKTTVLRHEREFQDVTERFEATAAKLALSGPLRFREILSLFQDYPVGGDEGPMLYEELVLMCVWTGNTDLARRKLQECIGLLRRWENYVVERVFGSVDAWTERMEAAIADPEQVWQTVESEIERHKLKKIPTTDLVY